jgi:hypothetical protein
MKKHPVKPNTQHVVMHPRREHARRVVGEDDGYRPVEAFFQIPPECLIKGKGGLIVCGAFLHGIP